MIDYVKGKVNVVEVLLYVHRNRRFIRDGEPRTSTLTFTQLLSSEAKSMNKAPHNLFMLISNSQVSISSVKAVWQEWFGLNPDCF